MKVFGEIITKSDYPRSIQFEKEYFERFAIYKQYSGSCFVVDFELKILPGKKNGTMVYWIDNMQTNRCIESIYKGIEKFIEDRNSARIGVKPFEIIISGAIYHEVDFNSGRYVDYTSKRMTELSFEIGTKRSLIRKGDRSFTENDRNKILSVIKKFPSASASVYDIKLPNRMLQKLKLPLNYTCQKEFNREHSISYSNISIVIEEKDYKFRHTNHITVLFEHNKSGTAAFISIIEGIKKFVTDVYDAGYDLGGFNIYILESDLTSFRPYFSEDIYWFLKELIATQNLIDCI